MDGVRDGVIWAGVGISQLFSGVSRKRFQRILWHRQRDARGMCILSCPLVFSLAICCAYNSSNSVTTTGEKEIDHGATDNLYFLVSIATLC